MNNTSAVRRHILPSEGLPSDGPQATSAASQPALWPQSNPESQADLRRQVADRLAAHRARRARLAASTGAAPAPKSESTRPSRPNAIAAAVAERYAHSPSYRSVLAQEAERATRQAAAAAEVAARNAAAIADAEQQLLQELELWDTPLSGPVAVEPVAKETPAAPAEPAYQLEAVAPPTQSASAARRQPRVDVPPAPAEHVPAQRSANPTQRSANPVQHTAPPVHNTTSAGLTVRLYEDLGRTMLSPARTNRTASVPPDLEEVLSLEEEIAFRQAPVFEEPASPTVPIPANLLEFPRQLVAARKARPVLALGPLLEAAAAPSNQLRIFEVEPEQISPEPLAPSANEWTSIYLDSPVDVHAAQAADTHIAPEARPDLSPAPPAPQVASLGRRVMSATVDAVLVFAAFVIFSSVLVAALGSLPLGLPLALAAMATLAVFAVLYQVLFFTFSDRTPGMGYARIGLCTFSDENPTRAQMRRRLIPSFLALMPLGLGYLWAILDQEHMGWHDRISQTYQREY